MQYEFPKIQHIDDVYPHIDETFQVAEKEDYVVFNYILSSDETFPKPINGVYDHRSLIRRECRGIAFEKTTGRIVRRPYHKFFNWWEREETCLENPLEIPGLLILDKLDGSMIAPFTTGNRIIWGTRAGETDFSEQVNQFLKTAGGAYHKFAEDCINNNATPIFEWVSPKNRIVLSYERDNLILTGVRDNVSGQYSTYETLRDVSDVYNIPYVQTLSYESVEAIYKADQTEGVVCRLPDGHMFKIKAEWYVHLHRLRDDMTYEKGVISMILDGKADDVMPFLMDHDKKRLETFQDNFTSGVSEVLDELVSIRSQYHDRKQFALEVVPKLPKPWATVIFSNWNNPTRENMYNSLTEMIKKNLSTQTRVDSVRSLWYDRGSWNE